MGDYSEEADVTTQAASSEQTTREATHAGSWYSSDERQLSSELDGWLDQVPGDELPKPNARIIIAPHAGYAYSGPTAAYAYANLDVSAAKRVFLLGPSHHSYLSTCALTTTSIYETPLGPLTIDLATTAALKATGKFSTMSLSVDEAEHSLELHLPYIYKILSRTFGPDPAKFPPLVPMMVGNTSLEKEKEYGKLLAPYLADPGAVCVVSSDFAHWGERFGYTYYLPELEALDGARSLQKGEKVGKKAGPKIWESIEKVDKLCMEAVEGGSHRAFTDLVEKTGNTVCGRHPIGVVMAAVERIVEEGTVKAEEARFTFTSYAQSSKCEEVRDSSVSYASAFARLEKGT